MKLGALSAGMIAAARDSLGDDWKAVRHYAEPEIRRLARSLADIEKLAADGKITAGEAESLLRIHRSSTLAVMLTVKGLGLLAAEAAINAALKAAAGSVNATLPFKLL